MGIGRGSLVLLKDGRQACVQHMHSGYYDYAMTGLTESQEIIYFNHDDVEEVLK